MRALPHMFEVGKLYEYAGIRPYTAYDSRVKQVAPICIGDIVLCVTAPKKSSVHPWCTVVLCKDRVVQLYFVGPWQSRDPVQEKELGWIALT